MRKAGLYRSHTKTDWQVLLIVHRPPSPPRVCPPLRASFLVCGGCKHTTWLKMNWGKKKSEKFDSRLPASQEKVKWVLSESNLCLQPFSYNPGQLWLFKTTQYPNISPHMHMLNTTSFCIFLFVVRWPESILSNADVKVKIVEVGRHVEVKKKSAFCKRIKCKISHTPKNLRNFTVSFQKNIFPIITLSACFGCPCLKLKHPWFQYTQ